MVLILWQNIRLTRKKFKKKREFLLQQSQDHNKTEKESNELPNKIRGVYDILVSDQCSKDEKQAAIRSIREKNCI